MNSLRLNRRDLSRAGFAFGASAIATLGIGAAWTHADDRPGVSFVGCGSRISILIKSGPARVLLLSGSNAADFANGIARVMRPGNPRIDLLLIPGIDAPISLANRASHILQPRLTISIGPAAELTSAQLPADESMLRTRQIQLPNNVFLEVTPEADGSWWATVGRNTAHLLVLASADAANARSLARRPTALAQLGGKPSDAALALKPGALVVAASALSGPAGRTQLAEAGTKGTRLLRVFGGDAMTLGLTKNGISIPM